MVVGGGAMFVGEEGQWRWRVGHGSNEITSSLSSLPVLNYSLSDLLPCACHETRS